MSALKLTVQELLPALLGARAHGVTLELEPAGPPLMLKATVPMGALLVPPAVSATVTVQVSGVLGEVESGQSSVVIVVRVLTSTVSVPLLPLWTVPAAGL